MDLSRVKNERSELLQLLLLLIIVFLGIVTYISFQQEGGYIIPIMAVLSLLACLYVVGKERKLGALQTQLIQELIEKERKVHHLDTELKEEQQQLQTEKDKSQQMGLRFQELTGLYRAIGTVTSVMDLQQMMETVLRAALELVDAKRGSLMLLDETREHLSIACGQGLSDEVVADTKQSVKEGIAGWVIENSRPLILTDDVKEDEHFRYLIINDYDVQSAMSVPLLVRGRGIGVINFNAAAESAKKFTDTDLRVAAIFAQHAAIAIENVQLSIALQKLKAPSHPVA